MNALIDFAAQAAIDEIEFPTFVEGPSDEWSEGMWQSFREEFPSFTDEDIALVDRIFKATVQAHCKRNNISL